jgi:hypothetical protein
MSETQQTQQPQILSISIAPQDFNKLSAAEKIVFINADIIAKKSQISNLEKQIAVRQQAIQANQAALVALQAEVASASV